MSVEHISAAFRHSKANLAPRFVLVCLSNFADAEGFCYPSVKCIAKYCGMSDRCVQKSIDKLIELKELAVAEKGGTIDGKKLANVYRVILPVDGCTTFTGARRSPVHVVPKTGERGSNRPVNDVRGILNKEEPKKETTTTARAHAQQNPEVSTTRPAPEKAAPESSSPESSSLSVVGGGNGQEPSAELSAAERQQLETLSGEFGLSAKQCAEVVASAKRKGTAYVLEQTEIVRSQPRKNAAGALLCALANGWKPRVPIARKVARRKLSESPRQAEKGAEDAELKAFFSLSRAARQASSAWALWKVRYDAASENAP